MQRRLPLFEEFLGQSISFNAHNTVSDFTGELLSKLRMYLGNLYKYEVEENKGYNLITVADPVFNKQFVLGVGKGDQDELASSLDFYADCTIPPASVSLQSLFISVDAKFRGLDDYEERPGIFHPVPRRFHP